VQVEKANQIRAFLNSILDSYAIIFFIGRRTSFLSLILGFILLIATFTNPTVGLCGLLGIIASGIAGRLLSFTNPLDTSGYYNFNSLLVSLGIGYFATSLGNNYLWIFILIIILSFTTTILSVGLARFFREYLNLPTLSIPFVIVELIALAGYIRLNGTPLSISHSDFLFGPFFVLPQWLNLYLKSLGSILFSPSILSGFLIAVAILIHSRISFILSLLGYFVGVGILKILGLSYESEILLTGYNTILTAIALGGVFFIPDITSFLIALFSSTVGIILALGFQNIFSIWKLPVLALPFNIIVWIVLYSLRHRLNNIKPYLIQFYMGSPEENLEYYNMRIQRFLSTGQYQFFLPFYGEWVVTQGNSDELTHRYEWRHAWDFEVKDENGIKFSGSGQELNDYYCFDKPILAPAHGTVVKVVDWVPDNAIGEINTKENWGNYVVIYHAPGIYSLLAHLKFRSIKVKEGESVYTGQIIGRCGNSGRSVIPHLHFHAQSAPEVGAPTLPVSFVNYLRKNHRSSQYPEWVKTGVPQKGEAVRPVEIDPKLQELFNFRVGNKITYKVRIKDESIRERLEIKLDFWGNLYIKSERKAEALFSIQNGVFYLLKFKGQNKTALYALALALPSFIYEKTTDFFFTDQPPIISSFPLNLRILQDFLSFFNKPLNFTGQYKKLDLENGNILIEGNIVLKLMRYKLRSWQTTCIFNPGDGIIKLEVQDNNASKITAELVS
jgi:urea transporter